MEHTAAIQFDNYTFRYYSQAEPTLHEISLTIHRGEKVLIAGPSGSGKSTLGHCINGLIPYAYQGDSQGHIYIQGEDTEGMSIFDRSKKVGTILQDSDGQFIGLTAGEDIAFALENDCVEIPEMKEAVLKAASLVGMGTLLEASPFELSGGQKQRVAFAGVMVDDVDILLFDEPLANLDPAAGKTAIDLIDRVTRQTDKTVVIIEHRLEDVLYRHVDRIIVISDGRIAADMTPDALMCSGVLADFGIREPLYITAMKYAGIPITPELHPGRLATLELTPDMQKKLQDWYRTPLHAAEKQGEEILKVRNLSFRYDSKRPILKNISFSIKAGEMVSIVGANGAGKSTLAKVICGFVQEDEGELLFAGSSLKGLTIKERASSIGYVMQNPNQMICKSMIFDEVALGLKLRGQKREEIRQKVEQALRICGLYPFRNWPVSALSFGQKKRVTIASMLVLNPRILILDEPTAGQDYRHYTEIMEFLKELNSQGITILLITHDMHLMLEYTQHAIAISDGRIIADGSAVDILTSHEVANRANLKLTSLYEFAEEARIKAPVRFVQHFIDYEREVLKK